MASNKDTQKPLSFLAIKRLEDRGEKWKRHVEKHAQTGESWEAADIRLRREKATKKDKIPITKSPILINRPSMPPCLVRLEHDFSFHGLALHISQHFFGMRERFIGNFHTAQHARDFLAAVFLIEQ